MKLARVGFDDENRIEREFFLETTGPNRFWYPRTSSTISRTRGRTSERPPETWTSASSIDD